MQKILNTELYDKSLLATKMLQLKLTPEQAAKICGVSTFSIHAGLAGNLGTLRVLRKMSDGLKVKWPDLFKV
jgi:hypothetical protein